MSEPVRLAVWSGPRNVSTALMRSWENRDDCVVVDDLSSGHGSFVPADSARITAQSSAVLVSIDVKVARAFMAGARGLS